MSRVTELEKALTTLFRKGTEVGYTETEIDEFLENIDYTEPENLFGELRQRAALNQYPALH